MIVLKCLFFEYSMGMLRVMALLCLGLEVLSADLAKGKQLYLVCNACHGDQGQGNAVLMAPTLAGQENWYLKTQILKFKDGIRGAHPKDVEGMQMRPMSMTLTDDASIDAVVAYIKTFPPAKVGSTLQGGNSAKGKQLFVTCSACHGPEAKGNPALKAPSLKQLPDWYLLAQLLKFKEGIRGAHPKDVEGMQMRPMAMMLPDDQAMKDVIAHIHALK